VITNIKYSSGNSGYFPHKDITHKRHSDDVCDFVQFE